MLARKLLTCPDRTRLSLFQEAGMRQSGAVTKGVWKGGWARLGELLLQTWCCERPQK